MKLQDVHKEDFEREIFRLKKIDLDALNSRGPFMPNKCPACKSPHALPKFDKDGFHYLECDVCQTLFLSPVPTNEAKEWYLENSQYLKYWRENKPTEVRATRNKVLYSKRANSIAEVASKYNTTFRRILEIGGGMGEMSVFLEEVLPYDEYLIVEPQLVTTDYFKVKVINSTIENLELNEQVDLVLAYELIEHITDPDILLSKIISNLVVGGFFILTTPSSAGFDIQVLNEKARAVGYDHVSLYNVNSLKYLLERHGFEIVEISTPGSLDVQMVKQAFDKNEFQTDNIALNFLMENGENYQESFQEYLKKSLLSSHMICIAKKR
ncbi:MAG: methyltransferase domain-containing protein [Bacteroidales bacterium]